MKREIALKVLLGFVGLALLFCLYPLMGALIAGPKSDIIQPDQMILGIYFPFGIFFLMAIRNPAEYRTLIWAFIWSTLAHDAVMVIQAVRGHSMCEDALPLGLIALTCALLAALAPRKNSKPTSSAAVA